MRRFVGGFLVLVLLAPGLVGAQQDRPFQYHGIKSGMTRSEVRAYLDLDSAAKEQMSKFAILYRDKSVDDVVKEYFERGISSRDLRRLSDKNFRLLFFLTDDERLWRLDVYLYKPSDPAKALALAEAVRTRFKDFSIKEESSTSQHGTSEYYRVIMVDQTVLTPAVKRYVEQYLKSM